MTAGSPGPPVGYVIGDDGSFVPQQVLQEERDCIERLHALRARDGVRREPFSVAFSGGGMRAAAFQSGVLWRLAEADRLKDVEYLAAVSGGGYIAAAFASHCCGTEPPQEGHVGEWYREAVAKTIARMYNNAGDFLRDCLQSPTQGPYDKVEPTACLPRILDLPMLALAIVMAVLYNPFVLVMAVIVPLTIFFEFFFGGTMRAAFCAGPAGISWVAVLLSRTPLAQAMQLFGAMLATTFVVFIGRRVIPCCKRAVDKDGQPIATTCFLFGYNAVALLTRLTVGMFFIAAVLFLVPALQIGFFSLSESHVESRQRLCYAYIRRSPIEDCAESNTGQPWFRQHAFANITAVGNTNEVHGAGDLADAGVPQGYSSMCILGGFLLAALALAACCIPILGADLLMDFLCILGPAFLGVVLLCFVQFRVYGPLTMRHFSGGMVFDKDSWDNFVEWVLLLCSVCVPFSEELRSILHQYYRRSLQVNFFKAGEDVAITELAKQPYCPFLILTGTCSDFAPVGDSDSISELSMSALHCGSIETGYVSTPSYRSLAKCTALTGAGCLDAISLSMSNALSLRFWLQVLNLSWGDYLIFEGRPLAGTQCLGRTARSLGGARLEAWITRALHRLPSSVFYWTLFALVDMGWQWSRDEGPHACAKAQEMYLTALCLGGLAFLLSFFSFLPYLNWLGLMPIIRQIHQVTMYCYIGDVAHGVPPPRMLYVTDGGVRDCTALVQLMQRRCKRIFLVLAAADPCDDLGVLRSAMQTASKLHLGSFYDPEDPRRDVNILFGKFKTDKSMPFLHVGILYGWGEDGKEVRGDLLVVKNRLPPDHVGEAIRPPPTLDEICANRPLLEWPDADRWKGMTTDSLGPFGCCDCCHTHGLNCGPKFPHGTFTGYLYLSPQWCASLARLGHDLAVPVLEALDSLERNERNPAGDWWRLFGHGQELKCHA